MILKLYEYHLNLIFNNSMMHHQVIMLIMLLPLFLKLNLVLDVQSSKIKVNVENISDFQLSIKNMNR